MRTKQTITWLLGFLTLMSLAGRSGAWAQNEATPPAANQSQVTQPPDGTVNWKGVGLGAGAVAGNIVYVPAKLAYGILGGIGGAAGYALTGGNKQVANSIWRSSLGGDYVLTPDMMSGKKPIYFSGPSDAGSVPAGPTNSSSSWNSPSNAAVASSSKPPTDAQPAADFQNPAAPRPIDSGAGLVGNGGARRVPSAGANNPDYSYSGDHHLPGRAGSRVTDTSIE
jgi:hypothetical protein